MIIREMKPEDVPAIAELEKQCFSAPWSENMIISSLENRLSCWLVAEIEGAIAGYVGSEAVLDSADMMNIAVHPDYRRQGIAWELVERLVTALRENDVTCLTLEVRASNAPAQALYEALAFQQVGRRPNYYRNPKEDALILRKEWSN